MGDMPAAASEGLAVDPSHPVELGAPLVARLAHLSPEEREAYWYQHVYRPGERQLTVRAVLMGMALGGVMSVSNLYVGLKVGWSFGVTITAGILAFAIFKALERILPGGHFTDLENNAMQSVSSAAGFMASAGLVTAVPAMMLMNLPMLSSGALAFWMFSISLLGVMVAVPLKRQMINVEALPFPSGIAAAETIKTLHGEGSSAIRKAIALGYGALAGAVVAFLRDGFAPLAGKYLKGRLPDWAMGGIPNPLPVPGLKEIQGVPVEKLTVGFDSGLLLYAAGAIVGLRTGLSILLGGAVAWLVIAPHLILNKVESNPITHKVVTGGFGPVVQWMAWPGSGMLVLCALVSVAFQWKSILRAFTQLKAAFSGGPAAHPLAAEAEVPTSWVVAGLAVASVLTVALQHYFFEIPLWLGGVAVLMAMALSMVAARVTGETDITPPLAKISQVVNAAVTQGNPVTNLMTANVTAGASIHSADLLTDLKSGYLLGARPRHQFLAQLFGVLAGTLACVPAFHLLVPNAAALGDKLPAPGAFTARATAEAMAVGLQAIPPTAITAMTVTMTLGFIMTVLELLFPSTRRWMPSPVGIGLGMVVPFSNGLAIAIGAILAHLVARKRPEWAESYVVTVSSGVIAGESLMAVAVIVLLLATGLA